MRIGSGGVDSRYGVVGHPSPPTAAARVKMRPDHMAWMGTSLLLWLCALPVIGVLVLPWFGGRVALVVAAGLLLASVTACYTMCTFQVAGPNRGADDE